MKVFVYFNSMEPAGGIERVVASHIGFLSTAHNVVLVTKVKSNSFFPLPECIEVDSLMLDFTLDMQSRWKRIFKVGLSLCSSILALRRTIRVHRPDIFYVATPLNLLELFLAGVSTRKILVTEHSSFSAYNRIYKLTIRFLYPRVGLLAVPTTLDSEMYKYMGIRNVHLPNPISFYPDRAADLTGKVALCVGRLTDDKRHDLLLEVWRVASLSSIGWHLKIIGAGENELLLRKKITCLGLDNSVTIEMPTPSIQDEFLNASIFLLTSRTEGFGLVLAEALACGVPCICFDCPSGPRDIIEDGNTGRLIVEGDLDGFAVALKEIALDVSMRLKFGSNGRLSVKKFSSEVIAIKLNSLLDENFSSHLVD